jgi:glucosamine--fructose-6-phosphate aminotransferase (isomerizing)
MRISQRVSDVLDNSEYIENLAEILKDKESIFLIGRSVSYATALESALKLKEVSYIHAEALAGGEIKHGTLALIEPGVPCITFVPGDDTDAEILSNAQEVRARGGYIIGVGPKNHKVFDFFVPVPNGGDGSLGRNVFHPILSVIPMQILAYKLALLRGCDPDKPRNLAKSVTVK